MRSTIALALSGSSQMCPSKAFALPAPCAWRCPSAAASKETTHAALEEGDAGCLLQGHQLHLPRQRLRSLTEKGSVASGGTKDDIGAVERGQIGGL